MVLINRIMKEITLKIVYYGPGLSGKTTNIEHIYKNITPSNRGKMVSVKTDTERTLFFDFLPVDIGRVKGMNLRTHLYSVAGQVFYDASRRLILKGCDGIIFVVDGQIERLDANIESIENLKKNMLMNSLIFDKVPMVVQYNKTDLPNSLKIEELQKIFNPDGKYSDFNANALNGRNVFETFKTIVRLIIKDMKI
ncbi:MAG TPA: GTPase domain-containing protein [bacterium]|jgi:GTPase SAR1 family protein|nr:GTPase domain-containing protein [bacterium]HQO91841.1 GTPase domain-containing protein [bacterium]